MATAAAAVGESRRSQLIVASRVLTRILTRRTTLFFTLNGRLDGAVGVRGGAGRRWDRPGGIVSPGGLWRVWCAGMRRAGFSITAQPPLPSTSLIPASRLLLIFITLLPFQLKPYRKLKLSYFLKKRERLFRKKTLSLPRQPVFVFSIVGHLSR